VDEGQGTRAKPQEPSRLTLQDVRIGRYPSSRFHTHLSLPGSRDALDLLGKGAVRKEDGLHLLECVVWNDSVRHIGAVSSCMMFASGPTVAVIPLWAIIPTEDDIEFMLQR
jgi:hypothetical protein